MNLFFLVIPVTFLFSPSADGNPTGYKLLVSTTKGAYSSPVTIDMHLPVALPTGELTFTVPAWDTSITQFVVARAYNKYGDSLNSNEILVGPATAPGQVSCTADAAGLQLRIASLEADNSQLNTSNQQLLTIDNQLSNFATQLNSIAIATYNAWQACITKGKKCCGKWNC